MVEVIELGCRIYLSEIALTDKASNFFDTTIRRLTHPSTDASDVGLDGFYHTSDSSRYGDGYKNVA